MNFLTISLNNNTNKFWKVHSQIWENFWQLKTFLKWWKLFDSFLYFSIVNILIFLHVLTYFNIFWHILIFLFHIKSFFVLKMLAFLSWLFDHIRKWFDDKAKVNFKTYDAKDWTANNRIYILLNIAGSKTNQAGKFDQLIEYKVRIFFLKYYAKNEAWRLVPGFILLSKKTLYKIKASGEYLSFNTFW